MANTRQYFAYPSGPQKEPEMKSPAPDPGFSEPQNRLFAIKIEVDRLLALLSSLQRQEHFVKSSMDEADVLEVSRFIYKGD